MKKDLVLDFDIQAQPDDVTCGPTTLHAVYQYYGNQIPLRQVIKEVKQLKRGGTLAVMLGLHALEQGYKATVYTYNLHIFDLSWFKHSNQELVTFLRKQMRYKKEKRKLQTASSAYIEFIKKGGEVKYAELDENVFKEYLRKSVPILVGLSATYLYGTMRENPDTNTYDSIKGEPAGHFVIIKGFDEENNCVYIADPMHPNPLAKSQEYSVSFIRLINSIMLGIVTYDANLLMIETK
ncbi:MAG TPA: C39 family peptidase [Cyclobacteriaceae bacterium]|nr:C39 family peptidase [Cyclobacteriaceae bacterium]